MRLIYNGRMLREPVPDRIKHNPRLWTIIQPGHLKHGSTVTLTTLIELGLVKPGQGEGR